MAFQHHKDDNHNTPNWMIEPNNQGMPVGSNTDLLAASNSFTGSSNQMPFPLQSHNSVGFNQQQIPIQKKVAFNGPSQWPEGGHVPMGVKRKGDKKEKKRNKKKDKNKDVKISGPIGNVLHIGMQGIAPPTEATSPLGPGEHAMGQNWILGPKPPTSFPSSPDNLPPRPSGIPPHPSQAPPPIPPTQSPPPSTPIQLHFSSSHPQPLATQSGHSPALPGLGRPATPTSTPHAVPNQAGFSLEPADGRSQQTDSTGRSGARNMVDAKTGKAGVDAEIKRTMKASKIQRDVDILNHVLDDLESFISALKDKAAAWADLERKSKKSRRKKNDAVLESLKKRADPPTEQEFIVTYQKCKYGINLISKLGHHLSSPSPTQLLKGFFVYIQEMVNMNQGKQLASSIISPLFTKAASELMRRKLEPRDKELWGELGGNWLITEEQWPATQSPPPDYEIEFTDGCIPPNLHNSSDCPSNFPTLDTLPRGRRNLEYSEAYDGDQADGSGGLMISPAIISLMGATPRPSMRKNSVTDSNPGPLVAARSQQSLHSSSSLENELKKAKVIFDYEASALGELSVRRGETVEVLEETTPTRWHVKNKFGGSGTLPAQAMEVIIKKKPKSDAKPLDDPNVISLHGRNVPGPPKMAPPPIPSPSLPQPQMANVKYNSPAHGRKHVSQHPQYLFTVPEDSESRTSTISRPAPYQSLGSPPPFSPVLPQHGLTPPNFPPPPGGPAPPFPPGGVPPPPPPPPPVATPKQPTTLAEMIQKNKQQMEQNPQRKVSVLQKGEFDITEALSKRKPLRRTTTALVMETEEVDDISDISSELRAKLQIRKNSSGQVCGDDYRVLPWKATITEMKKWLIAQGYGGCAEKVTCKKGEELYAKSRVQLGEMLGKNDGVRLYSQLQADKVRAQKEGGAEKVSEFQKLMKARKNAADENADPSFVKEWGGRRPVQQEEPSQDEVPAWKKKLLQNRLAEKETVLDDTLPRGPRGRRDVVQRGNPRGAEWAESRHESRHSRNYSDEERREREYRGRGRRGEDQDRTKRRSRKYSEQRSKYSDDERKRHSSRYSDDERGRRYSDDEDDRRRRKSSQSHRRRRKGSENYDDERQRKKKNRRSQSSACSDDEGYKSRRRRDKSRHRRDKKRDDSYSDYDSEYERKKGKKKMGKKRRPTNIDDYDGMDYYSNSSYTSSSDSDSSSESDVTVFVDPADAEKMSERIKSQQAKIKTALASLSELQKESGSKVLAPDLQKMLQQDLQKLEQLQTMLRKNQGNQSLQTQLLGQQVLLSEHLSEAIESVEQKEKSQPVKQKEKSPSVSPPPLSVPANYRMQMLQQHALAAEHQMQALAAEQQMKAYAVEQQRQMLMAAEQQRQMQMAASMQSPYMSPQQSPFGMNAMSPLYSPYSNPVAYF